MGAQSFSYYHFDSIFHDTFYNTLTIAWMIMRKYGGDIISFKYFNSPFITQLARALDLCYLECCLLSFESFSVRSC